MAIVKEFREFIARGNVIDLAVGVIIGAAFGKIVNSLVADVMMPLIGAVTSKVDFSKLFLALSLTHYDTVEAAQAAKVVTIQYGIFINNVVQFVIVAACVFIVVKAVNKLKRQEAAVPPAPPRSEVLLEEIRDLLKK